MLSFIVLLIHVQVLAVGLAYPVDDSLKLSYCVENRVNVTGLTDALLANYDKQMLPSSSVVLVTMEMHVQDISSISELTGDFEANLMYSEIWLDPALAFHHVGVCKRNITMKSQFREKIWTPGTGIVNSKSARVHKSPSENMFVILYENGTVWANVRMQVRAPCNLDLQLFPFDLQSCELVFESYSYNSQEVKLKWFNPPVTIIGGKNLPDFDLLTWKAIHEVMDYPNGKWDQIRVRFTFARRFEYYLFQAYFPTTLTVFSSWIGFYLDIKSVSARITLGVSALLALTFQFGTVLRHLPRVSYIKCVDVWMITACAFIFFTLIELAIVCQLSKQAREKEIRERVIRKWIVTMKARRSLALATVLPSAFQTAADGELRSRQPRPATAAAAARLGSAGASRLPSSTTNHNVHHVTSRLLATAAGDAASPFLNHASHHLTSPLISDRNHLVKYCASGSGKKPKKKFVGGRSIVNAVVSCRLCAAVFDRLRQLRNTPISAYQVDRYAQYLFPVLFLVFNCCYWTYYLMNRAKSYPRE